MSRPACGGELVRQLPGRREVDRDALAHLERRAMVRDAGERESHAAKWVSGRATTTRATPANRRRANRRPRTPASQRTTRASA